MISTGWAFLFLNELDLQIALTLYDVPCIATVVTIQLPFVFLLPDNFVTMLLYFISEYVPIILYLKY